jgi:glutathione S-transferase
MGSSQSHHLELVSFELCPYVQRSVITLLHKKVDFKITYIDLQNPPAWFDKMSPLGKVPLLIVRESETEAPTVLFESAVINEYIDEVSPPMVMPSNPLAKAFERAWIAVSGELLMAMYPMMTSKDLGEIEEAKKEVFEILEKLEAVVTDGPFFSGQKFSLVDSSFAPFFMRLLMLKPMRDATEWKKLPNTKRWSETLARLESVKHSVKPDFFEKYSAMLKTRESAWADQIIA